MENIFCVLGTKKCSHWENEWDLKKKTLWLRIVKHFSFFHKNSYIFYVKICLIGIIYVRMWNWMRARSRCWCAGTQSFSFGIFSQINLFVQLYINYIYITRVHIAHITVWIIQFYIFTFVFTRSYACDLHFSINCNVTNFSRGARRPPAALMKTRKY